LADERRLVINDNLVFRLLQLHHLAELVRLAGFALANDFRRRLKQAEELPSLHSDPAGTRFFGVGRHGRMNMAR
jgi:hypothetical protein